MSEGPAADRIPIIAHAIESAYVEVGASANRSREHARRDLGAFDPLDAGWCPFELAGATSEPHWTQWVAPDMHRDAVVLLESGGSGGEHGSSTADSPAGLERLRIAI